MYLIIVLNFIFFRSNELEILDRSFKYDPVVSKYVIDESSTHEFEHLVIDPVANKSVDDENIIQIPVLVNKNCWYSKPIVMNVTTQQMFFQLSTKNNGMI